MTNIAIRVENLSKLYYIGRARERHDTLRDALVAGLRTPLGWLRRNGHSPSDAEDTIWALKDVSFEVKRGEVVGIIGRNGAGKSTLLKILSRITEPTAGRAEIHGRVGSLLEVGIGFHPELTGRENIYLDGAILGMRRTEIDKKFDEIVAFAEIEKFLDTPVKRYSSGMYVRLAFAVAAHLDPEILLVDEVLAVGDAAFQKKCLGKMGEVARKGRTVLFVSHSMPMIVRLCERAILLDSGRLAAQGEVEEVTRLYSSSGKHGSAERVWSAVKYAPGDSVARIMAVRVRDIEGQVIDTVDIRKPVHVEVEYWNLQSRLRPVVILQFTNEDSIPLFATVDFNNVDWWNTPRQPGLVRSTCKIPGNFFAEGRVFVMAAIGSYNPNLIHAMEHDAVSFRVVDRSEGDGVRGVYVGGKWPGVVRPMFDWDIIVGEPLNESNLELDIED